MWFSSSLQCSWGSIRKTLNRSLHIATWGREKKKKKRDQKRDRERNIKILTYILLVLTVTWFFIAGRDSHRRAILINKSNIELVDLESSRQIYISCCFRTRLRPSSSGHCFNIVNVDSFYIWIYPHSHIIIHTGWLLCILTHSMFYLNDIN